MASQIGGQTPGTARAGQSAPGAMVNPKVAMTTASSNRTSQRPLGTALRATI
jgi:hypothetical protein